MLVEVTQEDIDFGSPKHDRLCPIALALSRQTDCLWSVTIESALKLSSRPWKEAVLPRIATDFIKRFDAHKPVKPFKFEIDLGGNEKCSSK